MASTPSQRSGSEKSNKAPTSLNGSGLKESRMLQTATLGEAIFVSSANTAFGKRGRSFSRKRSTSTRLCCARGHRDLLDQGSADGHHG